MIGFGELRKLSTQWQIDLAAVERAYALDWLLKGIFDREVLREALALRGAAALSKAYFVEYVQPDDVDLTRGDKPDDNVLQDELAQAAREAADSSGLRFKMQPAARTLIRFEFTGPLGRRSAAQPHLTFYLYSTPPRESPVERPLLHPFSDPCETTVRTVSLTEMAAERLALFGQKPRAREVYDLWFILTRGGHLLEGTAVWRMAEQIAADKGTTPSTDLNPEYRPLLARAWENGLKKMRPRPSLVQAEEEIKAQFAQIRGG